MLNALRGRNQAGVEFFGSGIFLDQFAAFFDKAFHPFAFLALGAFVKRLKDFFEACNVLPRLLEVFPKRGP